MTAPDRVQSAPIVLPLRRKILFALITFVLIGVVTCGAVLALDVYLHHRVQYVAGVNVWGYRGAPLGKKRPGEIRIAAIGGSTVFGFGLPWNESWPYYLGDAINATRSGRAPVTVVNLGVPTDSARTFVATMDDYAYLKYDVAILYEGYNDLGLDVGAPKKQNVTIPEVGHYLAWRHQSPVFRWTGYFPIFPLVLNEKAMMLLHGGDLNAAYGSKEIVFRPGLATRAAAGAMKAAADVGARLEERFGKLTTNGPVLSTATDETCGRWSQYCGAMDDAVRHALDRGQRVIVVTQPYLSDLHVDQQQALASNLQQRFHDDRRVRYVNLGRLVDLRDPQLAFDGMHLVAPANEKIAHALLPNVLELLE
jgi:lysophospholipase L1-like esterase